MRLSIFQKIANWIKSWNTPKWLQDVLDFMFFDVVMPTLRELGEEGYIEVTRLIIDASKMDSLTSRQKFEFVYNELCKGWARDKGNIGESFLNRCIELVFAELKAKGYIQ